jgi:hypothetical protein
MDARELFLARHAGVYSRKPECHDASRTEWYRRPPGILP